MCYIAGSARGQYEANPVSELTTRANWQSLQLLEMPAVESQKSLEDRQNKENRNDCSGFIVLQTQLDFVLGSRSWKVILDSDVMDTSVFRESKVRTNFIEPFPKQNRTKLCKLVNNRCNDKKVLLIGLFVVSCRYEEMV